MYEDLNVVFYHISPPPPYPLHLYLSLVVVTMHVESIFLCVCPDFLLRVSNFFSNATANTTPPVKQQTSQPAGRYLHSIEQNRQPGICTYLHSDEHVAGENTTSPLKTNAHVSRFELSNLRLFLCTQSSNAEKRTVLGCHDHDPNTHRKRSFFNLRQGTEVVKERI